MCLLYFCFLIFFSIYYFNFRCNLLPQLILYFCIYQETFSCKYNPSRRLNIYWMKSKNIWLHLIASSFWSSMSYLSHLRPIIYCSNSTSLLVIIMHGLPISNVFVFKRSRSYTFLLLDFCKPLCILNTSKIKKPFFNFIRSNENSILEITAHKTMSHYFSFNIYLE